MSTIVADTSGLVSLGIVAGNETDPLELCLDIYAVLVPETVVAELRTVASYDDEHARAADAVLEQTADLDVQSVDLDDEFPLDKGENAAVTLADDADADLLLCDEFNSLGLVHASLANTRLVTTPTLLAVFVRERRLSSGEALDLLDEISRARSWDENSYVQRARSRLES